MEDERMDVNDVDSSPANEVEENYETPEETYESEDTLTEGDEISPEEDYDLDDSDDDSEVDDMGVPYKNRYMEAERKRKRAEEQMARLQQETAGIETQPPQEQKTTQEEVEASVEELYEFARQADDPSHRVWAYDQISKIQRKEVSSAVKEELDNWNQSIQFELGKKGALEYVQKNYPQAFEKDNRGNLIGWKKDSPLAQGIDRYWNSNPELQQHPAGLVIASRLASEELQREALNHTYRQNQDLKKKLAREQRNSMVEGCGSADYRGANHAFRSAMQKAKSGRVEDAQEAMANILARSGVIKE